ncbi:MAG: serine/threonine protein kinase [Chitinispirillaceae bacterium]|nr:serine/threonine protein kinase [Chitinispirillaceae bacterium]
MDTMPTYFAGLQHNDPVPDQEKPKTLGSGFVTSVLGEGGAAVVYEIWNPKLEIHRAVKLWRPNVSEKDLQRFETEIKITSKLDHPNIVEIHTVGEWNGLPFIEMERIDGMSLQQMIKANGAIPPAVALAIMIYICRGLHYAHQEEFSLYGRRRKGVIHCDIKPANIMITRNGVVKLMDFGIANPTNVSLHTDANKVTGSLQYMAPEQIRSRQVDARTDIYSAGVVLYEMLSGTRAFPSKQLLEVIEKRKANDYVPLNQFCGNLPKRIYRLVAKCMELQPEDRYQEVTELQKIVTAQFGWLTNDEPETVLQKYIEGRFVPNGKVFIPVKTALPGIVAGLPALVLLIILVVVLLRVRQEKKYLTSLSVTQPIVKTQESAAVDPPDEAPTVIEKVAPPPPPEKKPEPPVVSVPPVSLPKPAPVKARPAAAAAPRKTPVRQPDQLAALERMVETGKLSQALKSFSSFRSNDGLYYALYARCLYESGEWKKASIMAEKATMAPSKRISVKQRKGLALLYKAKYLSVVHDAAPSRDAAQAAINAWWGVHEHFEGTAQSAKASFAESEINRLSLTLGE